MATPDVNRAPDDFPTKVEQETIGSGGVSDAVASTDALGFEPYVKAVAAFLTNSATVPPLTLSVEGEWGAGKSSFMRLLRNELRESVKQGQKCTIVEFNAWRNDKEDALWAAFAIEFLRQLAPRSWTKRVWAHLRLWGLRFDLREGWYDALQFVVLLLAVLVSIIAIASRVLLDPKALKEISQVLFSKNGDVGKLIFGWGGVAAYIVLLFVFLRKFKEIVGNPFAISLQRYVDKPDYEEHTAFIEKFHRDFAKIVKTYLPDYKAKAFVFIDDLDRCEVPKAADLMQALNLLMSAESAPLIFVLGIDREMIAAGLAAKYEKLLPYFNVSTGGASGPAAGLEYGYAFLEKFIQLPFQVPRPRHVDVDRLLDSLGADRDSSGEGPNPPATRPDLLEVVLSKDSRRVREIIQKVAPPLDYNPRRLKQLVNAFRLKTFIASETGLFSATGSPEFAPLTLEKLAKVVALSLRWPRLLTVLSGRPQLLSWLQRTAWGLPPKKSEEQLDKTGQEQFNYWMAKPRLVELLRVPFESEADLVRYRGEHSLEGLDDEIGGAWSLDGLDLERLLETSPRRKAVASGPPTEVPTPGHPEPPEAPSERDYAEVFAEEHDKRDTVQDRPQRSGWMKKM